MGTVSFALAVRGIRKAFGGVEVLHGIDLDVPAGEVLALLGENGAGKSTLVKILAGDLQPTAGTIRLNGQELRRLTPVAARRAGIRMIAQELTDAPTLSVAENVALGRWPARGSIVRWSAVRRMARAVLSDLGVVLDLDAPVGSLGIAERQVVEIARAVSDAASCLILDEPTAALSAEECNALFGYVRRLRDRGVALVYITHRLDEVREIADRVAVLRDGARVLERRASGASRGELVSAMVGRALGDVQRPAATGRIRQAEPPALRLHDATVPGAFEHLDLSVRRGEVVALYGKVGSGTADVAASVFGLRQLTAGTLEIAGAQPRLSSPRDAIAQGVGFLPGDRQRQGAFPVRSIAENLAAPSWSQIAKHGLIAQRGEVAAFRRWHEVLQIRSHNEPTEPLSTLSGGNQQKVLIGRWLERRARVLLLVEPSRGVDVGAREEIYRTIRLLAADGIGVLVATSDHEEVVQLADRAVVMARGRTVAELSSEEITTERLTEEVSR